MAYKSIFEEGEIKPATTPKASTGYVSIFDDEEKKLEPITTTTVNKRYVQDPTRSNVSIPFEQADPKTQYENLTYDEIKKMKSSELVDLRRRAGIDKGDSKEWYSSFMAGIGDIMTTIGSTMKWKGAEGGLIDRIGENIQEAGKITQSKYTDYEALDKLGEFDWADMASPSFWQNKAPRLLPFTMSLIPAAIIGGSVGAAAGASFGLGALVTTITGAIGGTVLSRPLEGMMEAGSTYDEAIAKGFSEEKAQKAANQVFIENLKQMSVLDVIQMIPLLKGIKGFKIPNSTLNKIVNIAGTGTAIVSEGFEEVLQDKIVSDALGEKFDLASPETKESFVLGTIMGGVFQGTGGIVNISQRAITNATKENLSKKNQAIFEKNFDKFMKEGETRSDSEALALNEVAKIDQKGLQDAITKALNEKSQELKDAGIEQQASTVLKEETPADKLSKQIKKSDPIDRLLATIEEQEVETKVEEPLVQEARKYKNADEFVNNSINDLNPTGSIFVKHSPDVRAKAQLGENMTTLDKTLGGSPNDIITVYRGTPGKEILPGDFITTNKQLAQDYAGTSRIVDAKVKKGDIIDDITEPLGEEYIYRPNAYQEKTLTKSQLTDIWNKAQEKPTVKEAPTIKKPTTKKKVKEVKPTEEEIYKKGKEIIDKSIKNKEAVILDPDELKKIYKDYDPKNHKIYSSVNKKLFEYALQNVKNKIVKFIAGGSGSGKSNFVTGVISENFDGIILDGTLSNYDSFIDKLIMAKENGKKVKVSGIITNVGRAWKYVKKREKETGRGVPLDVFIDKHIGSAQTMIKIIENNNDVAVELKDTRKIRGEDSAKNVKFLNDKKYILAILRGLNYNKDVIRKKLEYEDTTRKIKLPKGAKQKASRIEMDRGRKERKLKGDKHGISYAETPEKISKLSKGDRADKLENFSTHYERIKGEFGYEQSGVLFETISTKDQIKKAFEYINRFPKQALQIAYGLREAPASIKAIAIRQSLAVSLREKGEYAKASEIAKMVSKELTEAAQTLNLAKTDLGIREETAIMNSIEQSRIESIGEKLGKIKDGDIKEAVKKEIRRKTEKATKEVVENQSKKTEKVMSEIDSLVDNIICK